MHTCYSSKAVGVITQCTCHTGVYVNQNVDLQLISAETLGNEKLTYFKTAIYDANQITWDVKAPL